MVGCLQVPCFRYFGTGLVAQLTVQPGDGADIMVRCPVRRGLYFLTPEERVRQALLWFLIEGARNVGGWRAQLRFEVEEKSIDLAACLPGELSDRRFVFNITVLIVETKRQERELACDVQAEEQLKTYMLRERCRAGLLFNAREAIWLSLNDDVALRSWSKDNLFDLQEAEERLRQATREATITALDYKNASNLAANGDFDSLLRLVSLIGSDPRITFTLSTRLTGNLSSVQTFGIRVLDADNIDFRARGVMSRSRQRLTRRDFHSLRGVRPA